MVKTYYELLGVLPTSEPEVIAAAYKALIRKYHPDKNNSPDAEQLCRELNAAYEILRDPSRRRTYDEQIAGSSRPTTEPPPKSPSGHSPNRSRDSFSNAQKENGDHKVIPIWALFVAGYIVVLVIYYGPAWFVGAIKFGGLYYWSEAFGAALAVFALGFFVVRLWRFASSKPLSLKKERLRWLIIQSCFVLLATFGKQSAETRKLEAALESNPARVASDGTLISDSPCRQSFDEQNWKSAAAFCESAANSGDAEAQNMLGNMHEFGNGFPANATAAVQWYRKAANQGLSYAQFNLARSYESGSGVETDLSEAARWYEKAGEQGHKEAQARLETINIALGPTDTEEIE